MKTEQINWLIDNGFKESQQNPGYFAKAYIGTGVFQDRKIVAVVDFRNNMDGDCDCYYYEENKRQENADDLEILREYIAKFYNSTTNHKSTKPEVTLENLHDDFHTLRMQFSTSIDKLRKRVYDIEQTILKNNELKNENNKRTFANQKELESRIEEIKSIIEKLNYQKPHSKELIITGNVLPGTDQFVDALTEMMKNFFGNPVDSQNKTVHYCKEVPGYTACSKTIYSSITDEFDKITCKECIQAIKNQLV